MKKKKIKIDAYCHCHRENLEKILKEIEYENKVEDRSYDSMISDFQKESEHFEKKKREEKEKKKETKKKKPKKKRKKRNKKSKIEKIETFKKKQKELSKWDVSKKISQSIKPGEITIITGKTGIGKSVAVSLMDKTILVEPINSTVKGLKKYLKDDYSVNVGISTKNEKDEEIFKKDLIITNYQTM